MYSHRKVPLSFGWSPIIGVLNTMEEQSCSVGYAAWLSVCDL